MKDFNQGLGEAKNLNNIMKTQYIKIAECGKFYYSDAKMETPHRTDGPAVEWTDGTRSWWIDGKRHRTDGPAVENANGIKAWLMNDRLHRTDGPAVEWADGTKSWYVDGWKLTEEQFNARFSPMELTLDQIAAKFGVDVNNLKIVK